MWPPPWDQPKPDPNVPYQNATNSVPRNSYNDNYWLQRTNYIVWQDPEDFLPTYFGPLDRCVYRGIWQSTILDLQPQYEGNMGPDANAQGVRQGSTMAIQVSYSEINLPFRVLSTEFCNVFDPSARTMVRVENAQDVTVDFFDAQVNALGSTIILTFRPPEAVRYWRVALAFDVLTDFSGDPPPPINELPIISIAATGM